MKKKRNRLEIFQKVLAHRLEEFAESRKKARQEKHEHEHEHDHEHEHSHGFLSIFETDGCSCAECAAEESEIDERILLIRLTAAAVLFIVVLVFKMPIWLRLLFAGLSVLVSGYEIIAQAILSLINTRKINENFLMSVAVICAFIIGEFTEGAAVMLLFRIGEYLQDTAIDNSRRSIAELMNIKPESVGVIRNGELVNVSPDTVEIGEHIVVMPGERVALDGVVVKGISALDTSALTGESKPRDVHSGDEVLSGSVNMSDALMLRVTSKSEDSTVSRILRLVEEAEEKRAKPEKLITRFARYYTPAVIIAALFIGLVVPLVFRQNLANWVHRALIFLVISCPCALVISVPLTYFAGIGGGSKKGILFKGADVLDALADTAVVIFDKTGTLTSGKFTVTDVVPNKITRGDLLKIAAYAESMSSHPIARSIIETSGITINRNDILNFHEERGMGCAAELKGGIIVAAGSAQFLKMVGVEAGPVKTGGSVIHIAAGGRYAGYIVLGDSVKADATNIVNRLAKTGVSRVAMFTGDNKEAANNAAGVLGISEVYSDCLPQDKMRYLNAIRSMLGKKEKLVFVGDGINDAPVIAASDIGIAMGGIGSDAAIEAAGVVIMTDEPSKVADAVAKARETKQIVRQNIIISIAIKVIIMVLAVCDVAPMWLGVGADVGVALLAILNATRAFGAKTDAKSGN